MVTAIRPDDEDRLTSLTSLVGREELIAEVLAIIERPDVSLLTLSGPGGIGKTRIALEAGKRAQDIFDGRVYTVFLASLQSPALLIPAILHAIDPRDATGAFPHEEIVAAIADRVSLLILDNFEHLGEAAPDVSWLLSRAPALTVLTTSRARLHVQGEYELIVPPLGAAPGSGQDGSPPSPAVQLFVERANAVMPGLVRAPEHEETITAICTRLDGLPLAIELAAARVKVLSLDAMLERLDHPLALLTGGALDSPDRHSTMRDAIAWSYSLLSSDERALFRTLCVFTGGFSLLEAESLAPVVGGYPAGPGSLPTVIDGLAALIDNSLLSRQNTEGEPRFVMLETIREFGWEELDRSGELERVRDAHADYFIDYAEAALPRLRGAERWALLERIERSHDNLRAALTWLSQAADPARAVQLAGALWRFWWWRSHLAEGRQRLEYVLDLPGAADLGAFYARALTGRGALAETQGDYDIADRAYDEAIRVWTELDDKNELAMSLLFRWLVALNANDVERMASLSSSSLALFNELGNQWGTAMSLLEQGVMAMVADDVAAGEESLQAAIGLFAAIDDPWGLALSRGVLGNIKSGQGEYAAAMDLLRESLSSLLLMDDHWGLAAVLLSVARTAAAQGEYEQVARVSGAIRNLHASLGALLRVPFRERYERNLKAAEAHLGRQRFQELLDEGLAMTPAEAVAAAIETPGSVSASRIDENVISPPGPYLTLSRREREVLRLVPGRTAREIGQELFISESTVRTHIEHILNKLALRNQKELIAYVYENHLM